MDKKKILIVDDEQDLLTVLKGGLAEEGYHVITADNGKDALNLAKSKHPDFIILDILMPDLKGNEVAMMLRVDPDTKDIPVIFLTGMFPKEGYEEGGRTMGSYLLLTKPYDIKELVAAIKKFMEKKTSTMLKK